MRQRVDFIPERGERQSVSFPPDGQRYVVARGHCPVCWGREVLIAHDIKQTTIFAPTDRARAEAHLRAEGSRAWQEMPDSGEYRIRGENPYEGEYSTDADAKCDRCRSYVGRLSVPLDTLFGRNEDRLIGEYLVI
ncbi:MAG: hypothetical protein QME77_11790 [bacterium]|nr:hypothetical protein [bacterium]